MGLVRRMGVGNKAYLTLVAEIERLRQRKQKLKDAEAERVCKDKQGEKFKTDLGVQMEYTFPDRESLTRKRNVATNVKPLMNGGVRGYIYVGLFEEYKFKHKAPLGYKYIKTARGHVKFNENKSFGD